ncbi:hypothetical protein L1987_22425 [Smallanthus sonchifolius]|uniref:Uncharacterized protein n=1 Tax=Smallanthus sonchifolius TaxID=185202 RepID=A0ACB9IFR3_9ASTR|nr:hypothetical protein L1987_22425 [Smallanthus sonchifolius]
MISLICKIIPHSEMISKIFRPLTHHSTTQIDVLELLLECIVWNHILSHNLYMKDDNHEEDLTIVAYVLYCFKTRVPCNLGYIMFKRMVNLPESFDRNLPFGILFTNLFNNLDICLGPSSASLEKSLTLNSIIREIKLP